MMWAGPINTVLLCGLPCPSQSLLRYLDIVWVQFNSDKLSIKVMADDADGTGPEERVEDEIPAFASREDTWGNQVRWERREMSLRKRFGVDGPHGAPIPRLPIALAVPHRRLLHGIVIVVVILGFREQKEVLVGPRWSIFDRFRLRVRLVPDDIRPQKPTIRLQRKGESPRDAKQIFRL